MRNYIIAIVTIIVIVSIVLTLSPQADESVFIIDEEENIVGEAYSSLFKKSYSGEEQESYEVGMIE
jgi:hypothetical protein